MLNYLTPENENMKRKTKNKTKKREEKVKSMMYANFDMEKLTQLAKILELSNEERELMFNLAGKKRNAVAPDLPEYIMERDYVSAALRTARDLDAGEEEWNQFVEELRKRKG